MINSDLKNHKDYQVARLRIKQLSDLLMQDVENLPNDNNMTPTKMKAFGSAVQGLMDFHKEMRKIIDIL